MDSHLLSLSYDVHSVSRDTFQQGSCCTLCRHPGSYVFHLWFLYWNLILIEKSSCCNPHIDGLVQERRNSIANALELHLSCTKPSIFKLHGTLMHQWIGSSLVQVIDCHLQGIKPLPEPMLTRFQLEHSKEASAWNLNKNTKTYTRKFIWKCHL